MFVSFCTNVVVELVDEMVDQKYRAKLHSHILVLQKPFLRKNRILKII